MITLSVGRPISDLVRAVPEARRTRVWGRYLFLFVTVVMLPMTARAELLDHIVAAVNYEVITASDLAHAIALNLRLGGVGQDGKALESETLEGLITRRLLVQEARRLRFVDISDQDVGAEIEKLGKRFGSDKALTDFLTKQDMTARELGSMLGERLLVERFVDKKVGVFVRVSRDEAQGYFDQHAAEFKGKRFQEVQKSIIAILADRKVGQQLEQYVAELRAKADIRRNAR